MISWKGENAIYIDDMTGMVEEKLELSDGEGAKKGDVIVGNGMVRRGYKGPKRISRF